MDKNPTKPRRFQFSLRSLLILAAVVAAGLSWWSYRASQQRQAVAVLKQAGAIVLYELHGMDANDPALDFLVAVKGVTFYKNQITASELTALRSLSSLEQVQVGSGISDNDLEQLRQALPHCGVGTGDKR